MRVSVFLTAVFAVACTVHAQNVTGSITGIVKDATGGVIPSAQVKALNMGTRITFPGTTDLEGTYTIRALPVGLYEVTVEAAGFKRFEARDIRVQVNESARVDITLAVGATSESVTVESQVVTVDTTSTTLKTVVDQKRIEELPLNGRNPTQLMRLVAGVTIDTVTSVTSGTTYPGAQGVSVNGGRGNTTNYVLDGAQNNDHYNNAPNPMPNPDALQEFSVQTNNFSAEFGRQSGGLVNAVTKSGTNDFHGSAFEFVRNKALNAANFFNPIVNGVKRDDGLKRNQYGATFGGPVLIPKIYNGKDKSFFFFSWQDTHTRRTPVSSGIVVPSAAERNGDFSELLPGLQLRNPSNGQPYAGNVIPASTFNPVSKLIVDSFVPLPTQPGNRISVAPLSNLDDRQFLVRGDQQITDKNRLSGRYWHSFAEAPGVLNPTDYLENAVAQTWLNYSTTLTDTHIISPNLTNQALFAFNRTDGNNVPVYPAKSLSQLGLKLYTDDKPQYYITVNGYWGTMNTGDTNRFLRDEYQLSDILRWTKGRHQMTIGAEYGHGAMDIVNNFRANGQFTFNGGGTAASALFTRDSFADFLLGKFTGLTQGIGEYKDNRFNYFSAFFQDSIKLNRRLTVNVGARWEPFFPYTDVNGKVAIWHPAEQSQRYVNAPKGVVFVGDPNVPVGGGKRIWNDIGPRVGFAWDVFGNGRTSVRGGYGIFFDRVNTLSTNSQVDQAPFGTLVSIAGNSVNTFSDPWAGTTSPFPSPTNPKGDVTFPNFSSQFLYTPDIRNPYVQSWNLTMEREMPGGFVTRVSYAGSKGTRLLAGRELNPAIYAPGATTATTNQRRPYAPALGATTILESVSNATYHSLQLTAERRFRKGFSILATYTFAKSIDDASANKANGISRTNPYNQAFDKGISDFDRQQVFNLSGLWELPVHFQSRPMNSLLGGWALNSIASLSSGYPFSVGSGVDNALTGTGGQRADLVGDPNLSGSRPRGDQIAQWLNRAAFAPNAIGTFGALGRNTFRGPGIASVDFGLGKNFKLTERIATSLRFEVFNAFNRVNLVGPNASISAGANFMRTTAAYDPRILQLALRLRF